MKKKLPIIISVIVIFYAVIFLIVILVTNFLPATIYDNQDMIIKNFNSANKMNYRKDTQDGITTIKCRKMTGMEDIWQYESDEDMMCQMYYTFNVTSGKAKLVFIQPDDTIITIVEQDNIVNENSEAPALSTEGNSKESTPASESVASLELKSGKNRIKIVCEKGASFSLSFRVS